MSNPIFDDPEYRVMCCLALRAITQGIEQSSKSNKEVLKELVDEMMDPGFADIAQELEEKTGIKTNSPTSLEPTEHLETLANTAALTLMVLAGRNPIND